MEKEFPIRRETPRETAMRRFSAVVSYLHRAESETDPRRSRNDRRNARLFAQAVLSMSPDYRQVMVDSFKALTDENPQMARGVYNTFKATRIMTIAELRQFLQLPPRGPIIGKLR